MHDVPLASYTSDSLSMIATKLGKPMMLDSYTSNMCLDPCGRSSYAMAMIEINVNMDLVETLIVGVPKLEETGYTKETIRIEYEWKHPRCDNCSIFWHLTDTCPNGTDDPSLKHPRSKSQLVYRSKAKSSTDTNRASTSKDTTTNVTTNSTSRKHGNLDGINLVTLKNSFDTLMGLEI
ncbi:zinc knuckle CX2CX4HX4C containing protein [Tanacetum coccineum]